MEHSWKLISKSIPERSQKEAIELIKHLVSEKMLEAQIQQDKATMRHLFAQTTCEACGTRHHHSSTCWRCYAND